MHRLAPLIALALPLALAACGAGGQPPVGGGPGPGSGASVGVAFAAAGGAASSAVVTADTDDVLTVTGSNGTLVLSSVVFVVSELELDCDDDRDDDRDDEHDDDRDDGASGCAEFEEGPFLVDLPLGSGSVLVTSRAIPAGVYDELEFEIEDLDLDDDDGPSKRARALAVLAEMRERYPAFPDDASMVVAGTFTPTDGAARPFVVFVEAEVEVELDLVPPLTVTADGAADRLLVVDVRPGAWFVRSNGTVRDLSAFDGDTIELEVEIEDGFVEVEFD